MTYPADHPPIAGQQLQQPQRQSVEAGGGKRGAAPASSRSLHGLDWLNLFLGDVQTGVGPFLAIYLATRGWNPQQVGIALTVGGIAGILAQTPAGALVDQLRTKRLLIAVGFCCLCTGALALALWSAVRVVVAAQVLIAAASSLFPPAIASISLGLVGHALLGRRQGRNQSWNSAGNVIAALSMGAIGYLISLRWIFFVCIGYAVPALLSLLLIRPKEIDYELARGARDGVDHGRAGVRELLSNRALLIFLGCAVLFHFANAAMLPLLGEMLSEGKGRSSPLFMSACVITTQVVITFIASPLGRLAESWGRKPLLLIGFAVLPIRGVLYTLTHDPVLLVAIQVLDGIGAAVFGVLSVLVIADLTRGTGRFNVTQGAIATAVGIGASLSQTFAGTLVHDYGYHAGFLFLAAVAAVAFAALWMFMPETRSREDGIDQPRGVPFKPVHASAQLPAAG
jgi:MFS family permease